MKKEIALIGYGRFGRFISYHLRKRFRVSVVESSPSIRFEKGIRRISIDEVESQRIIFLAVPISRMPHVLDAISSKLQPGTLVIDVCSVKEQPIRWMKSYLPRHVSILGTHPLFGPESASRGLSGHTIVLCPARIAKSKLRKIVTYLQGINVTVQIMTATQHDRFIASTLFLTQFIGRGLLDLPLHSSQNTTQNFQFLHRIATTTGRDTRELFRDMFHYNRFARTIPDKFIQSLKRTHNQLTT